MSFYQFYSNQVLAELFRQTLGEENVNSNKIILWKVWIAFRFMKNNDKIMIICTYFKDFNKCPLKIKEEKRSLTLT